MIGDIKVFEINIYEHSIYYDFEEPDDVFSNFLSNLWINFVPTEKVVVKRCISSENIQTAPYSGRVPIIYKRY